MRVRFHLPAPSCCLSSTYVAAYGLEHARPERLVGTCARSYVIVRYRPTRLLILYFARRSDGTMDLRIREVELSTSAPCHSYSGTRTAARIHGFRRHSDRCETDSFRHYVGFPEDMVVVEI